MEDKYTKEDMTDFAWFFMCEYNISLKTTTELFDLWVKSKEGTK